MCGIVGYIGHKEAFPILIKGLKRLEYRGYDSAGVALLNNDLNLNVYKSKGKVKQLEAYCHGKDISGSIGIAHTRWATHGEPNDKNAHPHYSQSENLALIHNGIIENYLSIKQLLIKEGYSFKSDTDTEVLVQLIEYIKTRYNLNLFDAVKRSLNFVIGAYAIGVIEKGNSDTIVAARKGSPLILGVGEGEFFLGSDATAIIEYTSNVIYLNDEEVAELRLGSSPKIRNLKDQEVIHEIKKIELALEDIEKEISRNFIKYSKDNLLTISELMKKADKFDVVKFNDKVKKYIERGEYDSNAFLKEIQDMISALVQTYEKVKGSDVLMAKEVQTVGVCPVCGSSVTERQKGFFCSKRECHFALWKNSRYFESIGKSLTSAVAQKLLSNGEVKLKGCKSAKTGRMYDATVVMTVTEEGKPQFNMNFENGGKSK